MSHTLRENHLLQKSFSANIFGNVKQWGSTRFPYYYQIIAFVPNFQMGGGSLDGVARAEAFATSRYHFLRGEPKPWPRSGAARSSWRADA